MQVFVHVTYTQLPSNGSLSPRASYTGWAFDTVTLQMVQVSGTWTGALLDPIPPSVYLADGDIIHVTCVGTTATTYRFKRAGDTFTVAVEPNSPYCGWTPPSLLTCTILIDTIAVNYDEATVVCKNFIGPLEYSLDGGNTRQRSSLFTGLAAGNYDATVFDLGATQPGCKSTRPFVVASTAPAGAVASVDPLPVFCFAGNPIVVNVQAAVAYHQVLVQVWIETAHRSGEFTQAYESKRRSRGDKTLSLDVHDILTAHLSTDLELTNTNWWEILTTPLRNWFVRVADVLPQTGKAGNWATSTNSLVMLGGLAPEPLLAGADYWSTARVARQFHTWQPVTKAIGRTHREIFQLLVPDSADWSIRILPYDDAGNQVPLIWWNVYVFIPPPATTHNAVVPPPLLPQQEVRFLRWQLDFTMLSNAQQIVVELIDTPATPADATTNPALAWPRIYEIDKTATPRQLLFENSLGGHDTLALFGKMSSKLTLDQQLVDAYQVNATGQPTDRLTKNWPGLATVPSYSLSTGWLSTDWLEYLRELVQPGRQVYELVAGQLRPVVLTTKELPTYQESEALVSAVIDYRPALINEYFSDYARNTNRSASAGAGW